MRIAAADWKFQPAAFFSCFLAHRVTIEVVGLLTCSMTRARGAAVGERGLDAPVTVMDYLVLHELPREGGKCKTSSVPVDGASTLRGELPKFSDRPLAAYAEP